MKTTTPLPTGLDSQRQSVAPHCSYGPTQCDECAAQQPDGVEISCADYAKLTKSHEALTRFVAMIARLTRESECATCGDIEDDNDECEDHELFEMPGDDAAETLDGLIRQARDLQDTSECPVADACEAPESGCA